MQRGRLTQVPHRLDKEAIRGRLSFLMNHDTLWGLSMTALALKVSPELSMLARYNIALAHDLARNAFSKGHPAHGVELAEELGDLLLQVVFHCQLAGERGAFDFDQVAQRRFPIAARRASRHLSPTRSRSWRNCAARHPLPWRKAPAPISVLCSERPGCETHHAGVGHVDRRAAYRQ